VPVTIKIVNKGPPVLLSP